MAITDAYATPALYRTLLSGTDSRKDEEIIDDLVACSRLIDRKLHTFFSKDDSLAIRYYMPQYKVRDSSYGIYWAESENPWRHLQGTTTLAVDPIASITGLEIAIDENLDSTYTKILTTNDYLLLPRNALVSTEPKPYTTIQLVNDDYWRPATEVRVTAIFGWPAVPKAIERACVHLAGILRLESPRATRTIQYGDTSTQTSRIADDVLEGLLKAYKVQPRV